MKEMFTLKNIGVSVLGGLLLATICRLGIFYGFLTGLAMFFLMPGIFKGLKKEKQTYKRFIDTCVYLEQMESCYYKNCKIYQSVKETAELFKEGSMKEVLKEALYEFEKPDAKSDASKRAFHIIENTYGCEQMELMHDFFLRNEKQGGDCKRAIDILEKRRGAWIKATEDCRSEKRRMLTTVLMSAVLLLAVSEALVLFLPEQMSIMTLPIERVFFLLTVVSLLLLSKKAVKKSSVDWLSKSEEREADKILRDYKFIEEYNPKKEVITSIKWAVVPAVFTVLVFVSIKNIAAVIIGFVITVLLLNQHKLEYFLCKKRIKKEVERDFPKFLFAMILLLKTESVQGALMKSANTAPHVLIYPLEKMFRTLEEKRTKPDAYFEFLEDFDVPKVHESMKLLYAISTGKGGNIEDQIFQIIEKNNDMTIRSEEIKNDNKVAGIMAYMFYVALPVSIKIIADIILIMGTLYGNVGNMV